MDPIQNLRREAQQYGYLQSGPQMQVVDDGGYIDIQPVGGYMYVPIYDPYVVFARPRPGFFVGGAIRFGGGFRWISGYNRFDWRRHEVVRESATCGRLPFVGRTCRLSALSLSSSSKAIAGELHRRQSRMESELHGSSGAASRSAQFHSGAAASRLHRQMEQRRFTVSLPRSSGILPLRGRRNSAISRRSLIIQTGVAPRVGSRPVLNGRHPATALTLRRPRLTVVAGASP